TGYTLDASSDALASMGSNAFDITPAAPHHVVITGQPSDVAAGLPITPGVQAMILDRFGNVATQATAPVSASLGSNPSGATLGGTATVNPTSGIAQFDNLTVNKAGLNYTLLVGSSGLFGESSAGFDVTGTSSGGDDGDDEDGGKHKLVFRTAPDHFAASDTLT